MIVLELDVDVSGVVSGVVVPGVALLGVVVMSDGVGVSDMVKSGVGFVVLETVLGGCDSDAFD